ncbi:NAD(P)H-binding protein [Streptomyces sp. NPDC046215]|uniref:NAD(P)H-binding protein n=1 Tax=Streptomyces stramineus TaxID=173861 RepID=A0ABP3KLZ8_9ACTN
MTTTQTAVQARTAPRDVLVLGATGKTGRRVVRRLREAGVPVRAASRSGEVRFDWAAPQTWEGALAGGVAAVYLIASDEHADAVAPFTEQAVAAGARRFVVLSGRGMDLVGEGFGPGMAAAERAVRASGAQWSIIRANHFSQNFDEDLWRQPLREGRLALPLGDVPEPFVDVEDVAEVAAALLTRDGHAGRVYDVSGPRGVTFAGVTDAVAKAAGRPVEYVELTPEEYRAELRAAAVPEPFVIALDTMFALHRAGHTSAPADGVQRVLGREPSGFEEYVTRTAATGAWSR